MKSLKKILLILALKTCLAFGLPSSNSDGIVPTVLVHGGAGTISGDMVQKKYNGTKAAVKKGYQVLENGGSPMDAVMAAIMVIQKLV